MRPALIGAILTLAIPMTAQAQHCLGRPSFRIAPAALRAGASFGSGAQELSLGASFGSAMGLFGGGDVSLFMADGVDEEFLGFSGHLGGALPSGKLEFCPIVGFTYAKFPEILGVDISVRSINGGVAMGGEVASSEAMAFLPFAAIEFGQTSVSGDGETFSETGGTLYLGGGLLINRTFSLTPSVALPISGEDSDPVFSISLSWLIGRR
jgi:hypothetical protein